MRDKQREKERARDRKRDIQTEDTSKLRNTPTLEISFGVI